MCGIAGLIDRSIAGDRTELERRTTAMAYALAHRGPDGSGVWVDADAGIALSHRRLAIIDLTAAGPHGSEFVLVTPFKTVRAVELLAMVVYFHGVQELSVGDIVSVGEPWLPGSTCGHLLVSNPYLLADELWTLSLPGRTVHFRWVIPITAQERAYATRRGLDALEQRFEEAGLEYWDPHRASVVQ